MSTTTTPDTLRPIASPESVIDLWADLQTKVWVAAALGSVLRRTADEGIPIDDPAGAVLIELGLMAAPGGEATVLTFVPAMAQTVDGREREFANSIAALLGRAGGLLTEHRDIWEMRDDATLLAQGRASALAGQFIAQSVVPSLEGLAERFGQPGATVLDIGVGVAGLACAVGESLPRVEVVGIDPFAHVLELARATITDKGLEERVSLRCLGVQDLDDTAAFDLAWLPAPFIPRPALLAGLPRVWQALRPGGWVLLASGADSDGLAGAIARLDVTSAGGTLLSGAERRSLLEDAGFVNVMVPPVPPGFPQLVAAQRPPTDTSSSR